MHHISNLIKRLFIVCLVLTPLSSSAQEETGQIKSYPVMCDESEKILQVLKDKYQEQLIMMGVQNPDIFMTLFINRETETFSVVVTSKSNGESCLLSVGRSFEFFEYKGGISL